MWSARAQVEIQAWGVSLLLLACGGRASGLAVSGGGSPSDQGGSSSAGGLTSTSGGGDAQEPSASGSATDSTMNAGTASVSAGGAAPTSSGGAAAGAGGGCTKEACKLSAEPSPLWVTSVTGYGLGAASIHFSESDQLVRVAAGEYERESTIIDRVTGELKPAPQPEREIVAEDASGRRVARLVNDVCVVTLDGAETFRFHGGFSKHVQFSPDGSAIADYSCVSEQEEVIQLDVYDTDSGQVLATAQAGLPCVYGDLTMLVDAQHRRTLFGHPARSELFVLDWDSQTIASHAIHERAPVSTVVPRNHEGTILNLKLSPNGRALVSVGAADGLAWLDPDTLAVEFRLPDVPFFNVYDQCYCTYLSESPVAWSPSGDLYATGHPSGGIALREGASQETLVVLEPPNDANVIRRSLSTDFGPVLIEFSPDMRHLVALYPNVAVGYSLTQE
jgi:WD40 repeat protein